MKKISTTKMNNVSKKRLRTIFKPRFIDNRTELHLLSLGRGGGVTEKVDGQFFAVKNEFRSNKVLIKTSRGEYQDYSKEPGHQALINHLQTEMYMDMVKLKRKYGEFEFEGELIYAPQEYYDDDNTVTIVATKYHKARMGKLGSVVIRNLSAQTNDEIIEDLIKDLQLYFNLSADKGFKCYRIDEMIPTEETETVVEIPKNCELEDIPNLLDKLAENTKSLINGKIDVKGCEVEGYVFFVDGISYAVINKRWKALKEKYISEYNDIANSYVFLKEKGEGIWTHKAMKGFVRTWVDKCQKWLNNKEIPKGVRYTKRERILNMLQTACNINDITLEDYLKFTNKILKCNV